jgi:hypothetical protein
MLASVGLDGPHHDRQELVRLLRRHKITIDCDSATHTLSANLPSGPTPQLKDYRSVRNKTRFMG